MTGPNTSVVEGLTVVCVAGTVVAGSLVVAVTVEDVIVDAYLGRPGLAVGGNLL